MRFVLLLMFPVMLYGQDMILGLRSDSEIFLSEGLTDLNRNLKATGTVRAIMLFAKFPDGVENDSAPRDIYEHLAPQAIKFFKESSYGRLNLEIDSDFKWRPISKPSTDPAYNFRAYETHKAYVAEAVEAADAEIDFSKYSIVYVVATRAKGWAISPTLNCPKDAGIKVDGTQIRHAVTFGNDCRNQNWGWQTLTHETGHIFGLPDLYNSFPVKKNYKSTHLFVGSWDPMGYQGNGSDFLAWQKYKLGWLDDTKFKVISSKKEVLDIERINDDTGIKACVIPISKSEAYVLEVRSQTPSSPEGVLIYKVSTKIASGRGPIQIMPAKEDDDENSPDMARKYIALYNALYFESATFEDKENKVRVNIQKKTDRGFKIEVNCNLSE